MTGLYMRGPNWTKHMKIGPDEDDGSVLTRKGPRVNTWPGQGTRVTYGNTWHHNDTWLATCLTWQRMHDIIVQISLDIRVNYYNDFCYNRILL